MLFFIDVNINGKVSEAMLDVEKIRQDFPMLNGTTMHGKPLIYFDNGATTLKPQCVIDAVCDYLTNYSGNAHRGDYDLSHDVDTRFEHTRDLVAKLINCDRKEVVYTYGSTDSLNLVAFGYGALHLQKDDEVLLTVAEHASNTLPWFEVCQQTGSVINYIDLDNEGRLTIENVKKAIAPHYTFFVADAMTGQDAVNAATEFNNRLEVTGVILTKTDGDARGGAALSIRYATGKPLMFIGTGEKPDEFELFHPDRMVSRILGMGDIVSLVERAQEVIDIEEAESMADKIKTGLDYNDILKQFSMMNKMGSLESILKMIPGLPKISSADIDESRIKRTQAIIYSMTKRERTKQDALNGSRKKRIARGAGVSVNEVNKLIDQLTNMNKMMKKVSRKVGGKTPDMNMKDLAKIMKGMKF